MILKTLAHPAIKTDGNTKDIKFIEFIDEELKIIPINNKILILNETFSEIYQINNNNTKEPFCAYASKLNWIIEIWNPRDRIFIYNINFNASLFLSYIL